ncbi:MAG: hypothetical protein ACYCTE_16810 [Acidimicrobiales bacterium]
MPRKDGLVSRIMQLRPQKAARQVPTGWWQDAKHRSQPPGSYQDPSLRIGADGARRASRKG